MSSVGLLIAAAALSADITLDPQGDIRTPRTAVAQARALRQSGRVSGRAVRIAVRPGRYRLDQTLVLSPDDAGLWFIGEGADACVFDGGVELPPFRKRADGLWETVVPPGVSIGQVWVDGQRAIRARMPNAGYFYMREQSLDRPKDAFFADPADVAPLKDLSADDLHRTVVRLYQSWDMGYEFVESFDAATGRINLQACLGWNLFHWCLSRPRYVIENCRVALDAPGEWFFEKSTGRLLYFPRTGETVSSARATVPFLERIVELKGTDDRPVRDIRFEGIGFEHAGLVMDRNGWRSSQGATAQRTAAVYANAAADIAFDRCRVARTAAHALWLRSDVHRAEVRHCLFEDLGGGGVYCGDVKADFKSLARNTSHVTVENSILRGGGRVLNAGIGVWLGHVHDCRVEHNDICDFYYTGISAGWTWSLAPTVVRNNRIAFNRIRHIGQGVLQDLAGIYMLGDGAGTTVCNNWISDVSGYLDSGAPTWGLYTDFGTQNVLLASNLVERCARGGLHQNFGRENTFANNLVVDCGRAAFQRTTVAKHVSLHLKNNVFCWREADAAAVTGGGGLASARDIDAEGNLWWCRTGPLPSNAFFNGSFAAWQKHGFDVRGLACDPQFVDAAKGDWRLQPDSPALRCGFKPFDWKRAGVDPSDRAWCEEAAKGGPSVVVPPPRAPRYGLSSVHVDFEKCDVGLLKNGMTAVAPLRVSSGQPNGVAFTDEDPAEGCRACRMTDSPLNKQPYLPHVNVSCSIVTGTACVSYWFKPVRGTGMSFELRDYVSQDPFACGLRIRHTDRGLTANGQLLAPTPFGQWNKVEIRVVLSGERKGTCAVRVTPRGQTPITRTVPLMSAFFRELTWVGFMTDGPGDAVWCLDDFVINRCD